MEYASLLLHRPGKVNLHDNTILITGGGSGIGLSLASEFLKLGNQVIISGRNIKKLKAAKEKFPGLEIIPCDISKEDSVRSLVREVHQKYPRLNVLVNNAGVIKMWDIKNRATNIAGQKEELLTNIFGTTQLTQSLLPQLLAQEKSAIIIVSSALAFVPMAAAPIYSATKAALHSYSISIRRQLQDTQISVFEVLPAAVDTQMTADMETIIGTENSGPKMSTEKLSFLILKSIANDTYEIRPGMANMLYRLHRLFPSLARNLLQKQSKKILLSLEKQANDIK